MAPFAISALLLLSGCSSDSDDGGNDNTGGTSGASSGGTSGSSGGGAGGASGGTSGGSGTDASTQGVTCAQVCTKVFGAGCMNGPPSEAICVALCDNITSMDSGMCKEAFDAMLACTSTDTTVTCTGDGDATSDDCPDEFAAIVPCLPMI